MNALTAIATFLLFTVLLVYAYLKLRDSRLRRRGATQGQLTARSNMTVLNYSGTKSGLAGLVLLLSGIWIPVEHELNRDSVPWLKSCALIALGVFFLVGSARTLRKAELVKRYSEED